MNPLARRVASDATAQIRADHAHVMALFHRYRLDGRGQDRRALADAACLALEVHARLEEELFYPAMSEADERDADWVEEARPEHERIRELIAKLRAGSPDDPAFDEDFLALMREVMHHVAEEETVLLPDAERRLGPQRLDEIGARMTSRRIALMAPRSGEMLGNAVRAAPASTLAMVAGGVIGAAWLARRAMHHGR